MNNLLVGNGINIQFNKTDYTTQQIVLRILKIVIEMISITYHCEFPVPVKKLYRAIIFRSKRYFGGQIR